MDQPTVTELAKLMERATRYSNNRSFLLEFDALVNRYERADQHRTQRDAFFQRLLQVKPDDPHLKQLLNFESTGEMPCTGPEEYTDELSDLTRYGLIRSSLDLDRFGMLELTEQGRATIAMIRAILAQASPVTGTSN